MNRVKIYMISTDVIEAAMIDAKSEYDPRPDSVFEPPIHDVRVAWKNDSVIINDAKNRWHTVTGKFLTEFLKLSGVVYEHAEHVQCMCNSSSMFQFPVVLRVQHGSFDEVGEGHEFPTELVTIDRLKNRSTSIEQRT